MMDYLIIAKPLGIRRFIFLQNILPIRAVKRKYRYRTRKTGQRPEKERLPMRRFLSAVMAIVMVIGLFALAGCKKADGTKDLEKVKSAGVLKVGMECAYAPFNWTQTDDSNDAVKIANAEGYANGYDVQIARKIAEKLGVKLEIYQYEWDALVPAVESGNLDCIIAGMSPTDERKELIDFSSNYYVSNLVIIVNKDSSFASATSLKDFEGAKVSAQDGTFHAEALTQIKNVQSSVMKDFTVLYNALTAKTIDGYIAEEPTAIAMCSANDTLTYAKLINNSTGFTAADGDVAIAVGMRKNSSLNIDISAAIDAISEADKAALMIKYIGLAPAEE